VELLVRLRAEGAEHDLRIDADPQVRVDAQVVLGPLDAEAYEKLHAYLRPAMG